jgi:hypothetical protein
MHADLNVAILELDRGSIGPDCQLHQVLCRHLLQSTDPLTRNQKAGFSLDDDLNRVTLGYIPANALA